MSLNCRCEVRAAPAVMKTNRALLAEACAHLSCGRLPTTVPRPSLDSKPLIPGQTDKTCAQHWPLAPEEAPEELAGP
eukprot:2277293-Alexandrium_andersonii.AAC.1